MNNLSDNDSEYSFNDMVTVDGVEYSFKCPLCRANFDDTDLLFHPCSCGYQMCTWCFQKLSDGDEMYGTKCPNCRHPYDENLLENHDVVPNAIDLARRVRSAREQLLRDRQREKKKKNKQQARANGKNRASKTSNDNSSRTNHNSNARQSHDSSVKRGSNNRSNGTNREPAEVDRRLERDWNEVSDKRDWQRVSDSSLLMRDSVLVYQLADPFNCEEAMRKNFEKFGRIRSVSIYPNKSAHIIFFDAVADNVVDEMNGRPLRFRGQKLQVEVTYQFRKPCLTLFRDQRCDNETCHHAHQKVFKMDLMPADFLFKGNAQAKSNWIEKRKGKLRYLKKHQGKNKSVKIKATGRREAKNNSTETYVPPFVPARLLDPPKSEHPVVTETPTRPPLAHPTREARNGSLNKKPGVHARSQKGIGLPPHHSSVSRSLSGPLNGQARPPPGMVRHQSEPLVAQPNRRPPYHSVQPPLHQHQGGHPPAQQLPQQMPRVVPVPRRDDPSKTRAVPPSHPLVNGRQPPAVLPKQPPNVGVVQQVTRPQQRIQQMHTPSHGVVPSGRIPSQPVGVRQRVYAPPHGNNTAVPRPKVVEQESMPGSETPRTSTLSATGTAKSDSNDADRRPPINLSQGEQKWTSGEYPDRSVLTTFGDLYKLLDAKVEQHFRDEARRKSEIDSQSHQHEDSARLRDSERPKAEERTLSLSNGMSGSSGGTGQVLAHLPVETIPRRPHHQSPVRSTLEEGLPSPQRWKQGRHHSDTRSHGIDTRSRYGHPRHERIPPQLQRLRESFERDGPNRIPHPDHGRFENGDYAGEGTYPRHTDQIHDGFARPPYHSYNNPSDYRYGAPSNAYVYGSKARVGVGPPGLSTVAQDAEVSRRSFRQDDYRDIEMKLISKTDQYVSCPEQVTESVLIGWIHLAELLREPDVDNAWKRVRQILKRCCDRNLWDYVKADSQLIKRGKLFYRQHYDPKEKEKQSRQRHGAVNGVSHGHHSQEVVEKLARLENPRAVTTDWIARRYAHVTRDSSLEEVTASLHEISNLQETLFTSAGDPATMSSVAKVKQRLEGLQSSMSRENHIRRVRAASSFTQRRYEVRHDVPPFISHRRTEDDVPPLPASKVSNPKYPSPNSSYHNDKGGFSRADTRSGYDTSKHGPPAAWTREAHVVPFHQFQADLRGLLESTKTKSMRVDAISLGNLFKQKYGYEPARWWYQFQNDAQYFEAMHPPIYATPVGAGQYQVSLRDGRSRMRA